MLGLCVDGISGACWLPRLWWLCPQRCWDTRRHLPCLRSGISRGGLSASVRDGARGHPQPVLAACGAGAGPRGCGQGGHHMGRSPRGMSRSTKGGDKKTNCTDLLFFSSSLNHFIVITVRTEGLGNYSVVLWV